MFGRSTASRFNVQKPASTPGPGEYEIKNLKSTKKGAISKVERKFEYQHVSEYAHLGPGSYKEKSTMESKGVAGWTSSEAPGSVDHAAAIKKIALSWQKLYGTEGSKKGEAQVKDREDVVAFLSKLVGDGSCACSEVASMKDECDSIRRRYNDEVAAALKPGRQSPSSSSSASTVSSASAWKKVEPLSKASEKASDDVAKKLVKLSGFLSRLSEDIPFIVTVLGEPEREKELMEFAEEASKRADKAKQDLDEAVDTAHEESGTLREALFEEKQMHAETEERCVRLERLVADGSARLEALEARMSASATEQQSLIESLMAFSETANLQDDDRGEEISSLAEELSLARARESEAVEELSALRASYLREVKAASSPGQSKLQDESLQQAEEAAEALEAATGEVHVYMELLEKSRKEARELRSELFKERASARRLKKTADALIMREVLSEGGMGSEEAEAADALLGWAAGEAEGMRGEEDLLVEGLMAEREELAVQRDEALKEKEEALSTLEEERNERGRFVAMSEAGLVDLSREMEQAWSELDQQYVEGEQLVQCARNAARKAQSRCDTLSLQVGELKGELSAALSNSEGLSKECEGLRAAKSDLEGMLHKSVCAGNNAVLQCEESARTVSSALVSLQQHAASKWQLLESECRALSQALEACRQNVDAEKDTNATLEARVAQLSNELRDLNNSQEALRGERDALDAALISMTSDRDRLSDTLEGVETAREALSGAKEKLESEVDALSGQLSEKSNALETTLVNLANSQASLKCNQDSLAMAEGDVASLQCLLREQKVEIASVKSQLQEDVKALAQRVDAAASRTDECVEEEMKLKAHLQCLSCERDALSEQVATMITERGTLKGDKDVLTRDKDALSLSLADAEEVNKNLVREIESLQCKLSDEAGKASELESSLQGLKGEKEGLQDMLMLAQEEVKTKWAEVLRLETKAKEGEEALACEQGKVKGLKGEVGRLETMVGDLETGVTSTEGRVKQLHDDVSRLNSCLASAEEREKALQHDVEMEKERVVQGEQKEEEGRQREEAARSALKEAEERCVQLNQEVQTCKVLFQTAQDEIASTIAERDTVNASLSDAKTSLQGVTDTLIQLRQDKEDLQRSLASCQADLKGVKCERDCLASDKEALESEKAQCESDKLAAEESAKIASGASDALRRNVEAISVERDALRQQLSEQAEEVQAKLDQSTEEMERIREAAASAHALHKEYRQEMQKLSASAQVSETLKAKLNLLEKDNQQLVNQNVHLVGHQNLKQKIHMHAKVKEENNKLKQEKATLERQVAQQKAQLARLSAEKTRVPRK